MLNNLSHYRDRLLIKSKYVIVLHIFLLNIVQIEEARLIR